MAHERHVHSGAEAAAAAGAVVVVVAVAMLCASVVRSDGWRAKRADIFEKGGGSRPYQKRSVISIFSLEHSGRDSAIRFAQRGPPRDASWSLRFLPPRTLTDTDQPSSEYTHAMAKPSAVRGQGCRCMHWSQKRAALEERAGEEDISEGTTVRGMLREG